LRIVITTTKLSHICIVGRIDPYLFGLVKELKMIFSAKVIGLPDIFDDGDREEQFVQVQFDDGTSVDLNEEELRKAFASRE